MIDLMGKKYYFFGLSIIIIIAGLVGYLVNGLKLGIEFEGGTIMQIQMNDSSFDSTKIQEEILKTINKPVTAMKSRDAVRNVDLLTINVSKDNTLTGEEQNKVIEMLRKDYNVKPDAEMTLQKVEPFIGGEILNNGLKAVALASIVIILYIWWRFAVMSGLSAGVLAILALLHDILIMLSVYTILQIPLNESFIAAVLTVLGYSMNDTIIIYDRIRENSNLLRKTPIEELVNRSIIQTLARSINTVLTVVICLVTVYVFAVYYRIETIREFSLPLIIGVTSGCYSSIFIASPLWILWKQSKAKKKVIARGARV